MGEKKRTEITFETDEVFISHRRARYASIRCGVCGMKMMTLDEAAMETSTGSLTICRWVAEGLVHAAETEHGALLICKDSLLAIER